MQYNHLKAYIRKKISQTKKYQLKQSTIIEAEININKNKCTNIKKSKIGSTLHVGLMNSITYMGNIPTIRNYQIL